MANKQELLRQFNLFSTDELERLIILGKTILKPGRDQLVQVDFARMVEHAHTLADQHFPEWTDRSKSDFGEFLVELMALFSDKDFFYINQMNRESYLSTMSQYKNIVHASISNGFKPPELTSASANVRLTLSAGPAQTVQRGAIEISLDGIRELTFSNDEFTIPENAGQADYTAVFKHGVYVSESMSFNGRSIVIPQESICSGSVRLDINGDTGWSEVTSFAESNEFSKNFMVLYNERSQAEIFFAPAGLGLRPAYGSPVTVTFRTGGGPLGNLPAGTMNQLMKANLNRTVDGFFQETASGVGTNPLPKEAVRKQGMDYQRNLGSALTPTDTESIAAELASVIKAKAIVVANLVYLYIIPEGGGDPAVATLEEVDAYFSGKLVMNYNLSPQGPDYVGVIAAMDIYMLPGTDLVAAKTIAEEIVRDYVDESRDAQFGGGFKRHILTQRILSQLEDAQNVDYNELYSTIGGSVGAPSDVILFPNQITRWSISNITVNMLYSS